MEGQELPADLRHVAGVLEGAASGAAPRDRAPRPRRPPPRQPPPTQQPRSPAGAAAAAADVPPADAAAAVLLSRPSPRSTPAVAHCAACDCFVPRGADGWETHLAGIRHRRQVLSLRLTGARGNLVVSAFEGLAMQGGGASAAAVGAALEQRAFGNATAQVLGDGHEPAAPAAPPAVAAEAQRMRTRLLAELLAIVGGGGGGYARAAAQVSEMAPYACASPPPAAAKAEKCSIMGVYDTLRLLHWVEAGWGGLASPQPLSMLYLQWTGAEWGDPAAFYAAAVVLVEALATRGVSARHLNVDVAREHEGWSDAEAAVHVQGWRRVVAACKRLLVRNPTVRELDLSARLPDYYYDKFEASARELRAVAAAAGPAVRAALLLGRHARAGARSPLQRLPREVMQQVLDLATPRHPTQVWCRQY